MQITPDAIEQPLATAEKRRDEIDFHLVYEAGREILLRSTRTACERYIPASGSSPRLLERRLDAVGDESKRRPR